jgi:hypothetical protein
MQDIRKNTGNWKAAAPDGREEEVPLPGFPTGAANDENGNEDDRSEAHKKMIDAKRMKAADNQASMYPEGSAMLEAILYLIEIFPSICTKFICSNHLFNKVDFDLTSSRYHKFSGINYTRSVK